MIYYSKEEETIYVPERDEKLFITKDSIIRFYSGGKQTFSIEDNPLVQFYVFSNTDPAEEHSKYPMNILYEDIYLYLINDTKSTLKNYKLIPISPPSPFSIGFNPNDFFTIFKIFQNWGKTMNESSGPGVTSHFDSVYFKLNALIYLQSKRKTL